MKTVCTENLCNGCMACVDRCNLQAITITRRVDSYNAVIDETKCANCNACHNICPRNRVDLNCLEPIRWYQGWAKEDAIRLNSSSGGAASSIMYYFVKNGGIVCSCVFHDGEFVFQFSNEITELKKYSGSKYVKSNPKGIYRQLQSLLMNGKKVLFIGLPCQAAGVRSFIPEGLQKNLYVVDLICHGTPDIQVLKSYLLDHGFSLDNILGIRFRNKGKLTPSCDYVSFSENGVQDRYTYSFLKKICYTENCYSCQFASTKRISDLTLGDSWGSDIDISEKEKGISLLLVQTDKGNELVNISQLALFDVDIDKAISANKQLQAAAELSKERERFVKLFNEGKRIDRIVFSIAPKMHLKNDIKTILTKLNLLHQKPLVFSVEVKK